MSNNTLPPSKAFRLEVISRQIDSYESVDRLKPIVMAVYANCQGFGRLMQHLDNGGWGQQTPLYPADISRKQKFIKSLEGKTLEELKEVCRTLIRVHEQEMHRWIEEKKESTTSNIQSAIHTTKTEQRSPRPSLFSKLRNIVAILFT